MKTRAFSLNDDERRLWVLNDEGLYNWWQTSGRSMRAFIRENRTELDECIRRALEPPKPRQWWEVTA